MNHYFVCFYFNLLNVSDCVYEDNDQTMTFSRKNTSPLTEPVEIVELQTLIQSCNVRPTLISFSRIAGSRWDIYEIYRYILFIGRLNYIRWRCTQTALVHICGVSFLICLATKSLLFRCANMGKESRWGIVLLLLSMQNRIHRSIVRCNCSTNMCLNRSTAARTLIEVFCCSSFDLLLYMAYLDR